MADEIAIFLPVHHRHRVQVGDEPVVYRRDERLFDAGRAFNLGRGRLRVFHGRFGERLLRRADFREALRHAGEVLDVRPVRLGKVFQQALDQGRFRRIVRESNRLPVFGEYRQKPLRRSPFPRERNRRIALQKRAEAFHRVVAHGVRLVQAAHRPVLTDGRRDFRRKGFHLRHHARKEGIAIQARFVPVVRHNRIGKAVDFGDAKGTDHFFHFYLHRFSASVKITFAGFVFGLRENYVRSPALGRSAELLRLPSKRLGGPRNYYVCRPNVQAACGIITFAVPALGRLAELLRLPTRLRAARGITTFADQAP